MSFISCGSLIAINAALSNELRFNRKHVVVIRIVYLLESKSKLYVECHEI